MSKRIHTITPCLWFDDQAEAAANFYVGIFPNSRITAVSRYGEAGKDVHGKAPGSVLTVGFELDGQGFTALNGGPVFTFSEAVSFMVACETQEEVDHFWTRLAEGGDPNAQQCGWLKDRFGLSWQVVPRIMMDMLVDPDHAASQRAFAAMMQMRKLDIAVLKKAYDG